MLIILPNQIDGLAAVELQLSANILQDIVNETSNANLDVALPKFKVESNVEMQQVLQQMGMTDLFDPLKADFSPMSGAKDLFVSDVIHKAYIDVNEKGSEAAAATGALFRNIQSFIQALYFILAFSFSSAICCCHSKKNLKDTR